MLHTHICLRNMCEYKIFLSQENGLLTMAIRIFTDSTSDIAFSTASDLGVDMLPLKVSFGDEHFVDKITITSEEFFKKLQSCDELPKTTLINTDEFVTAWNKYPDDDIVGIFVSSALSGTFNAARLAKDELNRNNIYLVDSQSTTMGLSMLVYEAVKLRDAGVSASDIQKTLCEMSDKLEILAVFDTLKYLVKGGRLSGAQGVIGGLLGIKPIIQLKRGVISNVGKARGMEKGVQYVLDYLKSNCSVDETREIAFAYSATESDLNSLAKHFANSDSARKLMIGSVVGTYAGPGAIAIGFFNK